MVRRRPLLAYLIGAGVAGTLLLGPFVVRDAALRFFVPGRPVPLVPFFLLPVAWGLWNLLWARWQPRVSIGTWGAALGLGAAVVMNVSLRVHDAWFRAALILTVFLPVVYYLVWHFVVGPLNEALGVEGERSRADVARRETQAPA
jgi:hypothetical protein